MSGNSRGDVASRMMSAFSGVSTRVKRPHPSMLAVITLKGISLPFDCLRNTVFAVLNGSGGGGPSGVFFCWAFAMTIPVASKVITLVMTGHAAGRRLAASKNSYHDILNLLLHSRLAG